MKTKDWNLKRRFFGKTYITVISILISSIGFAQNVSLTGKLTDTANTPLDGQLYIFAPKDVIKVVKATVIVNGAIVVNDIPIRDFDVRILSLGFPDSVIHVNIAATVSSHDLGTIALNEKATELEGITVTAKIPLLEKTEEGSVLNVSNTILSSSVNTAELLSRAPGLIVAGSTVSVFGKGEALIYLNGKQIAPERLASIPVNLITKVEIVTNPSAKYDARGRAVVNVIMKKSDTEGMQGVLTHNSTMAVHYLNTTALNLNYRKKNVILSGDYSILSGTDWFNNTLSSQANYNGDVYTNYNYYEANTKQPYISNYKFGIGYEINKKSDLSIQYDGLDGLPQPGMATTARIVIPRNDEAFIKTFNNGSTTNKNNSINLNYNYKLDSLGSTLFIGGQYSKFDKVTYDQIAEEITNGNNPTRKADRVNDGKNEIQLVTAQFDVVKILKTGKRFETGAKFSYSSNDGKVDFRSRAEGSDEYTAFPQLSNNFLYTEKVPAYYVQYSGNVNKKLNFSVGARAELSSIVGLSRKLGKAVLDTTYLNIFPTGKLNYQISERWSASINFSKRINRPQYQSIDPFVWYQDSLTSFQGNTRLTPELVNSYEATVGFKGFNLKVGYAHSDNVLRAVLVTGNTGPNSFIFTMDNLQKFRQYSATLELPFETKYWSSYNSINYNLNQFFDNRPQYQMSMPTIPMWYFYLYQQFKIPKWFNIDITGEYTSAQSDAITSRQPLYQVAAGISRSFFNGKLSLRLISNDIFKTQRWAGERAFGNIYATYNQRFNTHYTRLSITYRFGGLKKSGYKNKSVNDDLMNRIRR